MTPLEIGTECHVDTLFKRGQKQTKKNHCFREKHTKIVKASFVICGAEAVNRHSIYFQLNQFEN